MKKRLFVAISVPEKMVESFAHFQKTLSLTELRWTETENHHLTLAFLGYVDTTNVNKVVSELEKIAALTKTFQLEFQRISLAPPNVIPRMIWAKFALNDTYSNLVDQIFASVESYTTEQSRVEKIPHITLARFREDSQVEGISLVQPVVVPRTIEVTNFSLFESILSSDKSTYLELSSFKMQG